MAVDNQDFTAEASLIPFTTRNPEPDRFLTSEPFGRLVHRAVNGDNDTLTGSAGGDTPRLRVFCELPTNFVYRLRFCMLQIISPDIQWGQAAAEAYLVPNPDESGLTTLFPFPLARTLIAQSVSGIETSTVFMPGGGTASGVNTYPASFGGYSDLPLFYGGGGSSSGLTLNVSSSTVDVAAGTFNYYLEWLVYNVEQAQNSSLYWPLPIAG